MADKNTSIYERIKEKEKEIKEAEALLEKLNKEVQALYDEKNNEEILRLFRKINDRGLSSEETVKKTFEIFNI